MRLSLLLLAALSSGRAPSMAVEEALRRVCEQAREALSDAAAADARLREIEECDASELARLVAAVEALDACEGERPKPAGRWVFPVAGVRPEQAIGGRQGSGFQRARNTPCYATRRPGHPAHDLFVHDREHDFRDAQGEPFAVRAVEDGWALVARDGWTPGNPGKGGNYLMLYLPGRRQVAYYAHLDVISVRAGERVSAGEQVGTVGRTGKNAWPRRSPTHLHFGLWDAGSFRPVDSYKMLRAARWDL